MSGAQTPPVNEVVLAVRFSPQDQLIAPKLPEMLGEWYESHPVIMMVPPYEMPSEHESLYSGLLGSTGSRIEIQPNMESRYWFSSTDDIYVIQMQRNYLALNWRRKEKEYVHYDELRAKFVGIVQTVAKNLETRGGVLKPEGAELSYINVIERNDLWSKPNDLHKLIDFDFWDRDSYEHMTLQYSKPLQRDGGWAGRTHVNMQPIYNWLKEESSLSLTLTARSGLLEPTNFEESLTFLDSAHETLNQTFLSMLRTEATSMWGLNHDS